MYNARIDTSGGKSAYFGFEYGSIFDIDPLSGIDVTLSTSQAYQQMGETVETQTVKGINRTIKGVLLNETAARNLVDALPPLVSGKLYFLKSGQVPYFCNIVIKKAPKVHKDSNGKMSFTMAVFCPDPFWYVDSLTTEEITRYESTFSYATMLDSHTFGTVSSGSYVVMQNRGAVDASFTAVFTTLSTTSNFSITNTLTGEVLKVNNSLERGDIIRVFHENGRIRITKNDQNIYASLDDDSTMFWLHPGDNIIEKDADVGVDALQVKISFNTPYMGVLA